MIAQCNHCGADLVDDEIDLCRVTPMEAREFRAEVRVGELVCVACWHAIRWPQSYDKRHVDEDEFGGWPENEWFP